MPDISMCSGEGCTKKETCYRKIATPSDYHQAYFRTPPHQYGECEYYWPMEKDYDHSGVRHRK